jgi:Ca2+-binding EF-hand superfamily protein
VEIVRRFAVMLAVVLSVSVALGQDSRGDRSRRGRSRSGDRASASGGSSRRGSSTRDESFLRRLDTNGNGMIDAEEVAGSYKGMVEGVLTRLGIELKYPIPLSKVAEAAAKAAHAGSSAAGDSESSPSENKPSAGDSSGAQSANGFSQPKPSQPAVPGFGQPSVSPNGGETKSAAASAPSTASASSSTSVPAKVGDASSESASTTSDPLPDSAKRSGPKSGRFLTPKERLANKLPEWFLEKDVDGDGQVSMAEFTDHWTPDLLAEFNRYDLNHDGIITAAECLKATEGPHRRSK